MVCAWAWFTRAVTAVAVNCWEAVWQVGQLAKTRSAVCWDGSSLILVFQRILDMCPLVWLEEQALLPGQAHCDT